MLSDFLRWTVGLVGVSVILGHFGTAAFVRFLDLRIAKERIHRGDQPQSETPWAHVPQWLSGLTVGMVERVFFTTIIAGNLSGTAIAMIGWTALKGAAYWNAFGGEYRAHAFVGLLGSLVSMLFSVIGAFICTGVLWYWVFGRGP